MVAHPSLWSKLSSPTSSLHSLHPASMTTDPPDETSASLLVQKLLLSLASLACVHHIPKSTALSNMVSEEFCVQ